MTDPRPCTGPDAHLWTSDTAEDRLIAAGMCAPCPIRQQCLDGAMARKERWGVWSSVDFSFGAGVSAFECAASRACNAEAVGIGRRGEHTVPTCKAHSFDAQVTVLEPVPRPVPAVERMLGAAS